MRIRNITLRNFRRHRDTTIEFPDGVIALLGRNGSGKSTILEAVGFALFGAAATRTGKDLLRWDGAAPGDPVEVHLEMEFGGSAVSVLRSLRGKNLTPTATLTIDGATQVAGGAGSSDAVTQEIERRLGMGRDAFFTTVVAQQKELARLADLGPAERKRLLLAMLGVDALDRAIATVRGRGREERTRVETLREAMQDVKALRGELASAQAQAATAGKDAEGAHRAWATKVEALEAARTSLAEAEAAHEKRRALETELERTTRAHADLERRAKDLAQRIADGRKAAARAKELASPAAELPKATQALQHAKEHDALQARLRRLQEQHDAIKVPPTPDGLLGQTRAQVTLHNREHAEARELLAVLHSDARGLHERMQRIASLGEQATCPTCERPLGEHVGALRDALKADDRSLSQRRAEAQKAADQAAAALRSAEAQVQELEQRARAHDQARQQRQALAAQIQHERDALSKIPAGDVAVLEAKQAAAQQAHDERQRALALADQAPALEQQMEQVQKDKADAADQAQTARTRVAGLPETATALKAARQAEATLAQQERTAERAHLGAASALALAERRAEDAKKRVDEAQRLGKKLREHEEAARYWNALAGSRGGGLLDAFKAHLVARVGPAVSREASRLLAQFTNGRYTEVLLDEEYRLFVTDGGVPYTLDRFSGGEADLVHLALRLGVSRLVAERSGGAEIRLLALDEVFGSLDAERRGHVLAALQGLRGLYSQVLLVTHQEALQEALDGALRVTEQDGEAVVSVHNG